jgi:hypothetical protein
MVDGRVSLPPHAPSSFPRWEEMDDGNHENHSPHERFQDAVAPPYPRPRGGWAALAALVVWAMPDALAGVDLTVRQGPDATLQELGSAAVVLVSVLVGMAGWALLAAWSGCAPGARRTWTALAVVVLALLLTGPLTAGTTTASKAPRTRLQALSDHVRWAGEVLRIVLCLAARSCCAKKIRRPVLFGVQATSGRLRARCGARRARHRARGRGWSRRPRHAVYRPSRSSRHAANSSWPPGPCGMWRAPTSPWRTGQVPPHGYRRRLTAPRHRRTLSKLASSTAHLTICQPPWRCTDTRKGCGLRPLCGRARRHGIGQADL